MLSVVLSGNYGYGGGSSSNMGAVYGAIFGPVAAIILLVVVFAIVMNRRLAPHQNAVYALQSRQDLDNKLLRLTPGGQPDSAAYTVTATISDGNISLCCQGIKRTSTVQLYMDNSSRHMTGNGVDNDGPFDLTGHFVLDSASHGHMAFTKTYDGSRVARSAGEFSTSGGGGGTFNQLSGSWYCTYIGYKGRQNSNGGPFTMSFLQPLTIVNTQVGAADNNTTHHLAINMPADRAPTAPSTPDSGASPAADVPPPPYSEDGQWTNNNTAVNSQIQPDMEMVQPRY